MRAAHLSVAEPATFGRRVSGSAVLRHDGRRGRTARGAAPTRTRSAGRRGKPSEESGDEIMTDEHAEPLLDSALAVLAREDPPTAEAAQSAYEALTWGQGLSAVSLRSLQDFLWYQLPTKWACGLDEKHAAAAALGRLFELVQMPRYAGVCTSELTVTILTTYERDGNAAGLAAYRKAIKKAGVEPPDVPGLFAWGTMMGLDEAAAFWAVATTLELSLAVGDLRPGARGWRTAAEKIATDVLTLPRPELAGDNRLARIHAERLSRWTDSRGSLRRSLASRLADALLVPAAVPGDAEELLAPVRWLLRSAADGGVPLTRNGTLSRATVVEACTRFDWFILAGSPRSESSVPEVCTLRSVAAELRAVRRSGSRLVATAAGGRLAAADTAALWDAVTPTLLAADGAKAAVAELELMLMLGGYTDLTVEEFSRAVADAFREEGWRDRNGAPPDERDSGLLAVELRRRLGLFGLLAEGRGIAPARLTDAGRAAAHTALRARALRART
jgi:hypothetical protein